MEAECQHLVQLTCSSCHFHASLPPVNTSLAVLSPLYPVLQPDYIYKYDFFSDSPPPQDVSLHIEDINLQRVMTVSICDSDVIKLDPTWTL